MPRRYYIFVIITAVIVTYVPMNIDYYFYMVDRPAEFMYVENEVVAIKNYKGVVEYVDTPIRHSTEFDILTIKVGYPITVKYVRCKFLPGYSRAVLLTLGSRVINNYSMTVFDRQLVDVDIRMLMFVVLLYVHLILIQVVNKILIYQHRFYETIYTIRFCKVYLVLMVFLNIIIRIEKDLYR